MQVEGAKFIFWDYIDDYGVFDEYDNLVGFKDGAPEDVKKSFAEFLALSGDALKEVEELADD